MLEQEIKQYLPNSKITPDAISDLAFTISGIRYDVNKLRFVGYGYTRLNGTDLTLPTAQFGVIMSAWGRGFVQIDGVDSDFQNQSLNEVVFSQIVESGAVTCSFQYAIFTFI